MRQSLRLGRIAGIAVGAHWSVLIIMLLLVQVLALNVLPESSPGGARPVYWLVAVVIAGIFMASLLVHELAHALVARHFGVGVKRITLWLLGGVSELESETPHPRADLLIALAGPAASMASAMMFTGGALASWALGLPDLVTVALAWLALVNATLALFNLLPGAPLDGGRVLRAILWRLRGDRSAAQRGAARAGVVLGALLAAAGTAEILITGALGGLWLVLLGWFLIAAANGEAADTQARTALGAVRVGDVMSAPPVCGYATQSVDAFVEHVARRSGHQIFPVIGLDGDVVGVVSLARLTRVPTAQRSSTRLRDVAMAPVAVLDPAQPLADVAAVTSARRRLSPVVAGGRLVGVLSSGDVQRAIVLAMLGVAPGRPEVAAESEPHAVMR